ncbi:DUF2339 domain-containing protein [Rhizorhapis sp. SPR117]|uniref:DUF2339 domain-containing protein n=1 Tax=Rhizorhapis sp. SPR117 TaxID=2912611 RepID=UPI001F23633A|nr:DUF2339 domain-containing protein [Rhizorhapis sp. SPR117]
MFGALVMIVMTVVIAEMWRRLNVVQFRLDQLEGRSLIDSPPVVDMPLQAQADARPGPWNAGSTVQAEPAPVSEALFVPESAPEAEPQLEPETVPSSQIAPASKGLSFSFEDLFGRRLPIWAGGITLAIAGVLIVKYSIDAGLLSPLVRVVFGLLFGAGLIGGAEFARIRQDRVRDPRVQQALAGAGIATLYSSILIATNVYALVGPVTAFAAMVAVTAIAMGLSLRFGAPSALLGLVGGLAAPALVGSGEPDIPLLSTYLALAVGGLCALSRTQRWMWLGVSALIGGFGWGAILLLTGALDAVSSLSIGLYVLLLGIAFPMLAFAGKASAILRVVGSVAAAAQMAVLVATGGFAMLHWGLFALISIAIIWLSWREEAFARLPAIGLGIALLLLGGWPSPALSHFVIVMGAMGLIYGAPALWRLWRAGGGLIEAGQITAIALAGLILSMVHFYRGDGTADVAFGGLSFALALLPAVGAMLGWNHIARSADARFAMLATASALLLACAAAFLLPGWIVPPTIGVIGVALLHLSRVGGDRRIEWSAWAFVAGGLFLLSMDHHAADGMSRLLGEDQRVNIAIGLVQWAGFALTFALFAWRACFAEGRTIAQAASALLAYGALAQVVPVSVLPLVPAIGLIGLAQWSRRLAPDRLLPGMGALLGLSLAWAAVPVLQWFEQGSLSLIGDPVLVTNLPVVRDMLMRLLLPSLAMGVAIWLGREHVRAGARRFATIVPVALGGVALHIAFKQLFALSSYPDFIRLGFAERTVWEALLLAGSAAAWHFASRLPSLHIAALGFGGAALAHLGWYTVLLHNPLFVEQAVGSAPVFNLLLPAYGLPLLWLWLARRHAPVLSQRHDHMRSVVQMVLITLFCLSALRQGLHGSILTTGGVSDAEDIFRSIIAILLAIGFLLWGIARSSRDWRIASLVLMIGAVGKVFLFDASGLDGLLRIGSFVALGFSLIGIGWLYSRHLQQDKPLTSAG